MGGANASWLRQSTISPITARAAMGLDANLSCRMATETNE